MTSDNQKNINFINPAEESSDEGKVWLLDPHEDEENDEMDVEPPRNLKFDNFEFDLMRGDIDSFVSTMDAAGSVVYENDQPYKYNFDSLMEKARVIHHSDRCDTCLFQEIVSIAFGTLYDKLLERLGRKLTSITDYYDDNAFISEGLPSRDEFWVLYNISNLCPRIPTSYHREDIGSPGMREQVLDGLIQVKQIFQNINCQRIFEAAAERKENPLGTSNQQFEEESNEEISDEGKVWLLDPHEDEENDEMDVEPPRNLKFDNFEFDLMRGDIDSFVSTMDAAGSVVYENDQPYKYNFDSLMEKARVIHHSDRCDICLFQEIVSIAFGTLYDKLLERLGRKLTSITDYYDDNAFISEGLPSRDEFWVLYNISNLCPRIPTSYHREDIGSPGMREQVLDGLIQVKQIFQNINCQRIFEAAAEREKLDRKKDE